MPIEIDQDHAETVKKFLESAHLREVYDAEAKKLLSLKIFLVKIIKKCIPELYTLDEQYILHHCFVSKIRRNIEVLDQDVLPQIETGDTDDLSIEEGYVHFDIVFDIAVPGPKGLVHIIVNIEMQKGKITYLLKRGDYYTSRLVSRQKGTVFFHDNYKDIVQVYSIWILPQPYVDNKNAITAFRYLKDDIDGATIYTNDSRNINNIVLISLGDYEKATPGSLLGLLDLIFTSRIDPKEKFSKLTNEFGIRVTETIKKGVEKMYSYVDSIAEDWAIDKAAEKIADVENYYRKIIDDWKMKEQGWEKKEQGWEKERDDLKKANDELHNQVTMLENKIKEMLKIKN